MRRDLGYFGRHDNQDGKLVLGRTCIYPGKNQFSHFLPRISFLLSAYWKICNFRSSLFSFIGNLKGRILQAYFDGSALRVWTSQIYDFEHNAIQRLNAFVQHMANAPVSNTFGGEEVVPDCSRGGSIDWRCHDRVDRPVSWQKSYSISNRAELHEYASHYLQEIQTSPRRKFFFSNRRPSSSMICVSHRPTLACADSPTSCIRILNSIRKSRFIPEKSSAIFQTAATIQQPARTGLIHCISEELRISADIIPGITDHAVHFEGITDATCTVWFIVVGSAVEE